MRSETIREQIDDDTVCIEEGKLAASNVYFIRGNAKHELGDRKGACRDWHKSLELFEKEWACSQSDPGIENDEAIYEKVTTRVSSLIAEHCPQSGV